MNKSILFLLAVISLCILNGVTPIRGEQSSADRNLDGAKIAEIGEMWRTRDINVRERAYGEFQALKPESQRGLIPDIIDSLKFPTWSPADRALIELGPVAFPELLGNLKDENPQVRAVIAGILSNSSFKSQYKEAVLPIGDLLHDSDQSVRVAGANALYVIGPSQPQAVIPVLRAALKNENVDVRQIASDALTDMGSFPDMPSTTNDARAFQGWWKDHQQPKPQFLSRRQKLVELGKIDIATVSVPKGTKGAPFELNLLDKTTSYTLFLLIPAEKPSEADFNSGNVVNGENISPFSRCENNKSWILAKPWNTWSSLDLNPNCSDGYGPDEVDISLYWLSDNIAPHIEVVTNGPACVPYELYSFDHTTHKFKLAKNKCKS